MAFQPYTHRPGPHHPRTGTKRGATDHLLEQIRGHVSEIRRLRQASADRAAVEARQREVERLQEQLADRIKQDPTGGRDAWALSRAVA